MVFYNKGKVSRTLFAMLPPGNFLLTSDNFYRKIISNEDKSLNSENTVRGREQKIYEAPVSRKD